MRPRLTVTSKKKKKYREGVRCLLLFDCSLHTILSSSDRVFQYPISLNSRLAGERAITSLFFRTSVNFLARRIVDKRVIGTVSSVSSVVSSSMLPKYTGEIISDVDTICNIGALLADAHQILRNLGSSNPFCPCCTSRQRTHRTRCSSQHLTQRFRD